METANQLPLSPEGDTAYAGVAPTFGSDSTFYTARALEISGIATFYGRVLRLRQRELLSTRYEHDPQGAFTARGRVSFAGTGVTAHFGNTMAFISAP